VVIKRAVTEIAVTKSAVIKRAVIKRRGDGYAEGTPSP